MPNKPRLLLLSYAFPPAALPEAFVCAKRMGSLPDYSVDVVCLQPTSIAIRVDPSLDGYVSERFSRIERIELPLFLRLLLPLGIGAIFQTPGLIQIINRKALAAAMRLEPQHCVAMVTGSQWHAIHLVGLELKRRFPRLPWIAHFSDPWADNPFLLSTLRPYNRYLEAQVYRAADALSFTSRETIDLVLSGTRSAYRAKAFEIPHAFEPALYPATQLQPNGPLVLRSLGNFYGARSPQPLLQALAILLRQEPEQLDDVRVELIGSMPSKFQRNAIPKTLPHGILRVLPPVDYQSSLALMRSADMLLNIDGAFKQSAFLPSKLVDYIGAGRPILGITPPGTASRIIRELGGWVAEPSNPAEIAAVLSSALTYVRQHRRASWGTPDARSTYAVPTVAKRFGELVRSVIAAN